MMQERSTPVCEIGLEEMNNSVSCWEQRFLLVDRTIYSRQ